MSAVLPAAGRVPVTILTGWTASELNPDPDRSKMCHFIPHRKTTMVNHILTSPDHKLRVAVIENEFG
eukprot:1145806-Pelagomonas_calceolata.AAC.2